MADAHLNFATSLVATAPSPATSGTSLVVTAAEGTRFPAVPFNAVVCPAAADATPANAEVVRVTAVSTDTFTITRAQESSSARTVVVGDRIYAGITAKTFTDIELGQDPVAARNSWRPTAAKIENMARYEALLNQTLTLLTSGTLRLHGGFMLRAGVAYNSITLISVGATGTPLNQWFCLVDQSLNVLVKTNDDTSTAWGSAAAKTLSFASAYIPAADIAVYVGVMVKATTTPTLVGNAANTVATTLAPIISGQSTSGLTNPASLGATAAALTANNGVPYTLIN